MQRDRYSGNLSKWSEEWGAYDIRWYFYPVVCLIYSPRSIDVVCIELLCSRVFTNRDCQKTRAVCFITSITLVNITKKTKTSYWKLTANICYILRIDFFFLSLNTVLARPFQERRYDFAIESKYFFTYSLLNILYFLGKIFIVWYMIFICFNKG